MNSCKIRVIVWQTYSCHAHHLVCCTLKVQRDSLTFVSLLSDGPSSALALNTSDSIYPSQFMSKYAVDTICSHNPIHFDDDKLVCLLATTSNALLRVRLTHRIPSKAIESTSHLPYLLTISSINIETVEHTWLSANKTSLVVTTCLPSALLLTWMSSENERWPHLSAVGFLSSLGWSSAVHRPVDTVKDLGQTLFQNDASCFVDLSLDSNYSSAASDAS